MSSKESKAQVRNQGEACGVAALVSKARRWQNNKRSLGLCIRCGKGKLFSKNHCKECTLSLRKQQREKIGASQWKLGHKGRPPIEFSAEAKISRINKRLMFVKLKVSQYIQEEALLLQNISDALVSVASKNNPQNKNKKETKRNGKS